MPKSCSAPIVPEAVASILKVPFSAVPTTLMATRMSRSEGMIDVGSGATVSADWSAAETPCDSGFEAAAPALAWVTAAF
jgi:hypothetical protein